MMAIAVGAESMSIDYEETERGDQLNVSCRVRGVYPQPVVQLATEDAHQTHRSGHTIYIYIYRYLAMLW